MKNKSPAKSVAITSRAPSEQDISAYAFPRYQQGHDLAHWLEASAHLLAGTPHSIALV